MAVQHDGAGAFGLPTVVWHPTSFRRKSLTSEPRNACAEYLAALSSPDLRISNLKDWVGPFHPEDFVRYVQALRLASAGMTG